MLRVIVTEPFSGYSVFWVSVMFLPDGVCVFAAEAP